MYIVVNYSYFSWFITVKKRGDNIWKKYLKGITGVVSSILLCSTILTAIPANVNEKVNFIV